MYLFLFIFEIVLLPEGNVSGNIFNVPASCVFSLHYTETKECPPGSQCVAARVVAYAGGSKITDVSVKSCSLGEECFSGSLNYGLAKTAFTGRCVTSDLCNNQTTPDPSPSVPNGKKCYSCNGQTCSATLNCEDDEDYCISARVTTVKGCASRGICSNLQSTKIKAAAGQDISCCQGDYYNSASSTSASLLLLVAPLIKFIIFS